MPSSKKTPTKKKPAAKKAVGKKPAAKKAPAKKSTAAKSVKSKPVARKKVAAAGGKKAAVKATPKTKPATSTKSEKVSAKKPAAKETSTAKAKSPGKKKIGAKQKQEANHSGGSRQVFITTPPPTVKVKGFLKKQRERLLNLKDSLLDSMRGVAKDTLRTRAEGSEGNAFGMHQADAGSDAYDRDFALSLLSQEQNSLYEIDQALKRIDEGNYGTCEMSGKPIPHPRLEALPFTRFTVECQAEMEKENRFRARVPAASVFGLGDDDLDGDDEDSSSSDNKD